MKIIVAGWRAARKEQHGDIISDGLLTAVDMRDAGQIRLAGDSGDVTLVHGGSPHGGVDAIATGLAEGWGWKVDDREHQRNEIAAGTGTGNYREICKGGGDVVVLFPGPNCADSSEAYLWSIRYGLPFLGFPLAAVART
jgi:hypothetical protein